MSHLAQRCNSSLNPVKCDFCPLTCGANRAAGESGLCGADDKMYVARVALHFWEEPPISGPISGPGGKPANLPIGDGGKPANSTSRPGGSGGSGTIFFSNCSMKCAYCQNHRISMEGVGREASVDDLVAMMQDLENQGAMNINFVTGTHYRTQIISAVRRANIGIPIVWNTSGYETMVSIAALSQVVDVWLPDFKYADDSLCEELSGNKVCNYSSVALEAIGAMLDFCESRKFDIFGENARMTRGIIVRHLLLPGHLDNSKAALKLLYENFGNEIKYSIMNQFTPVCSVAGHPELDKPASDADYEELLNYADNLGIEDYYWQQGGAVSESFIPEFE